ncbi:hypothetical protein Trydic_g1316 [Trypoxylus dichotomus]
MYIVLDQIQTHNYVQEAHKPQLHQNMPLMFRIQSVNDHRSIDFDIKQQLLLWEIPSSSQPKKTGEVLTDIDTDWQRVLLSRSEFHRDVLRRLWEMNVGRNGTEVTEP